MEFIGKIIGPEHEFRCYPVSDKKTTAVLPKTLVYLKPYLIENITHYSFFHQYYRFGSPDSFNKEDLFHFAPDVILITSFAFAYFDGFKEQTEYLKSIFPDTPIICGGQGPSSSPQYYWKNSPVDYVIKGPAETGLPGLLNYLSGKQKTPPENIYGKDIVYRENLSSEYSFQPFTDINGKTAHLHFTRGCPKRCTYCSVHAASGHLFLKSRLEDAARTIQSLPENIRYIDIEDDNISTDREYFKAVIRMIHQAFPHSKIGFENGMDFTTLDEELIRFLVDHNICKWNLSMVSVSSETLHKSKRNYLPELFEKTLEKILQCSLPVTVYFISGLKNDTLDNVLKSLFFLAEKNVIIGFSPFYPVPGTLEAEHLQISSPLLARGTSCYGWNSITTEEQISVFTLSRFINAIKRYSRQEWLNAAKKYLPVIEERIPEECGRDTATWFGVFYSLKKRCIAAVNRKGEISRFPMDEKVLRVFFREWDDGLKIRLTDGVFDQFLMDGVD